MDVCPTDMLLWTGDEDAEGDIVPCGSLRLVNAGALGEVAANCGPGCTSANPDLVTW
jgi:hypothetical protein